MRISGGNARGRTVRIPKGVDLRPTEERVRQALFNILGPSILGSEFLDLYCGSGAVGLEALSRGARKTVFVDRESRCLRSATEHASQFGFPPEAVETFRGDALPCLDRMAVLRKAFDFVFIDPPYQSEDALAALIRMGEIDILKPGSHSRVILEHGKELQLPEICGRFRLLRQYSYGNTSLSLYTCHDEDRSQ